MYSNVDEAWNFNPAPKKRSISDKKKDDTGSDDISQLNLSDSMSLYSANTCDVNYPITTKRKNKIKYHDNNDINSSDKCEFTRKHLKKCLKCHLYMEKQVSKMAEQRVDELIMEKKLSALDKLDRSSDKNNNSRGPNYTELATIIVGCTIAILLIIMMIKSFGK